MTVTVNNIPQTKSFPATTSAIKLKGAVRLYKINDIAKQRSDLK